MKTQVRTPGFIGDYSVNLASSVAGGTLAGGRWQLAGVEDSQLDILSPSSTVKKLKLTFSAKVHDFAMFFCFVS